MRNEILMKTPPPVFTAAPNAICPNNVAATFTVKPDCPRLNPATNQPLFPTTYDWTLSGSAVFQGSSGSQTITGGGNSQNVVAIASSGIVILTVVARRSGAAPSEPLVRYLTITRGTVMLEEDPAYNRAAADAKTTQAGRSVPTTDYSCSRTVYLLATGYNAPPPYVVSVTTYRNTGPTTTSFTTNTAAFQFAMFDFDVDVTVSTTSACDGGAITSDILSLTGCAGRPAVVGPAAYPNPADAVLHLATPKTAAAASGSRTAVLYNGQGREVRRAHPGEADLPTVDLPTGLYYLMTEHNSRVTRSQVRVQH